MGRLAPQEIALLRGGPRAAVTVAVLALHLRGAAMPDRPGTLSPRPLDTGAEGTPLEIAVHSALREPTRLRKLARDPEVRLAVARMRIPLAEAGLLRYPLLGPTRATRREVRALRKRHAMPTSRRGLGDHDKLLAVALHGEAALHVLAPRFALRAGLVPRAEVADKGLLKHSSRSGFADFGDSGGD
ncbi:TIGR04222 domain-containing membrane protein [Streptomyces sp. NPDC057877]|uniref:TIGR04222 domain-containing membrane protein n=1 Tax=Streptomyces sp. NPDC057877 TaxID=3346269 RepID=UPI003698BF43